MRRLSGEGFGEPGSRAPSITDVVSCFNYPSEPVNERPRSAPWPGGPARLPLQLRLTAQLASS